MFVRYIGLLISVAAILHLARPAAAQQNLFNVPSSEITTPGGLFFQQQFNFSKVGQSNTTVSYGIGNNWEVGINLLDLPIYTSSTPTEISDSQVNPDFLLNAQKAFDINDKWKIGIGTQIGLNPAPNVRDQRLLQYTYVNNVFELPDEFGKFILGGYYANHAYLGNGERFGFQAGVDIPIIKDKFHFQADYISGNSDISVGVIGGVVMLPHDWQFSFGVQLPAPRSSNLWGGVMELTWIPKGSKDKD